MAVGFQLRVNFLACTASVTPFVCADGAAVAVESHELCFPAAVQAGGFFTIAYVFAFCTVALALLAEHFFCNEEVSYASSINRDASVHDLSHDLMNHLLSSNHACRALRAHMSHAQTTFALPRLSPARV